MATDHQTGVQVLYCVPTNKYQSRAPHEKRLLQTWPSAENGYIRDGRRRMSLMIDMSLSETAEVASRGSSDTDFIIEYRALAATIKVIFMLLVRFQLSQPKNLAYSSVGRATEFLVP